MTSRGVVILFFCALAGCWGEEISEPESIASAVLQEQISSC